MQRKERVNEASWESLGGERWYGKGGGGTCEGVSWKSGKHMNRSTRMVWGRGGLKREIPHSEKGEREKVH